MPKSIQTHPLWFRMLMVLTSVSAYLLAFFLLEQIIGAMAVSISMVPVLVTGWIFGLWAGLAAGLLTFPLSILLLNLVDMSGWDLMFPGTLPAIVTIVIVGGLVGRLHDLSKQLGQELAGRKQGEKALQVHSEEMEEQSQMMLETISEGIMLTNDNGTITYVNPAFEKMLGFKSDELVSKNPSDFFKAYDLKEKPLSPELLSNSAAVTAKKQEVRVLLEAKDGRKVAVVMNSAPVRVGGEFRGVVRVVHDYTEDLMLQRQKDDFFSIASHELRTPLTVISGNLDIISDVLTKGKIKLKAEETQLFKDTQEATDRLTKMVSDFLNASRLDQGRIETNIVALDSCKGTREVIDDLKKLAEEKNLALTFSCSKDHGKIMADEGLLKQILINLISNSIKFTKKGKISVEHTSKNGMVTTTVTDTGMGIAKKNQKLLFHRFQQAMERTLSREVGGTGLGLYISREFARLMRGDLYLVKSELGKGSTFEFTLPLAGKSKK